MEKYLTLINLTAIILLLQNFSQPTNFLTYKKNGHPLGHPFCKHTKNYGKVKRPYLLR